MPNIRSRSIRAIRKPMKDILVHLPVCLLRLPACDLPIIGEGSILIDFPTRLYLYSAQFNPALLPHLLRVYVSSGSRTSHITTMRTQRSALPPMFLFLLILLSIGQLDSFSHGRRITNGEVDRWENEYPAPSMGYFSEISPSQELGDDDFSPIHAMSKRLVPQGPNPLHN